MYTSVEIKEVLTMRKGSALILTIVLAVAVVGLAFIFANKMETPTGYTIGGGGSIPALYLDPNLKAGGGQAIGYNPSAQGALANAIKQCCELLCMQVQIPMGNCIGSCMSVKADFDMNGVIDCAEGTPEPTETPAPTETPTTVPTQVPTPTTVPTQVPTPTTVPTPCAGGFESCNEFADPPVLCCAGFTCIEGQCFT